MSKEASPETKEKSAPESANASNATASEKDTSPSEIKGLQEALKATIESLQRLQDSANKSPENDDSIAKAKEIAELEEKEKALQVQLRASRDLGRTQMDEEEKKKVESAQKKMAAFEGTIDPDRFDKGMLRCTEEELSVVLEEMKSYYGKLGLRYEVSEQRDDEGDFTNISLFLPKKFLDADLAKLSPEDLQEIHEAYRIADEEMEKEEAKEKGEESAKNESGEKQDEGKGKKDDNNTKQEQGKAKSSPEQGSSKKTASGPGSWAERLLHNTINEMQSSPVPGKGSWAEKILQQKEERRAEARNKRG